MNEYIRNAAFCRFNLELLEHETTKALADKLKLSSVEAAGYLGMLVCLGISRATDEGLLDLSDAVIERECRWPGRRGQRRGELIKAFFEVEVLKNMGDFVQFSTDFWAVFAFDAIKKRKQGAQRQRKFREEQRAKKVQEYRDFLKT